MKQRYNLDDTATLIKEAFFKRGMEISRPVELMINDSYPILKRDRFSPNYDPKVDEEYEAARRRARTLLYEQRNIVQDQWLPRYIFTQIPGKKVAATEAWLELKSLLVDGCLDRLAEMLVALAPIIVAKDYVEGVQSAVMRVTEIEKERLTEYLRGFHVQRKPGVPSIEELLNG